MRSFWIRMGFPKPVTSIFLKHDRQEVIKRQRRKPHENGGTD